MRLFLANPRRNRQSGVVLVWTVFAIFVVMGSTFVTASLARTADVRAQLAVDRTIAEAQSHAAAQAGAAAVAEALRLGAEPAATGSFVLDGQTLTYSVLRETAATQTQDASGLIRIRSVFRVEGAGSSGNVTRRTRQLVQASVIPIFQFAIFYENDLEFSNPAPWQIRGRVHCNSDIYVRTWNNLTFDTNYLRTAGSLFGTDSFPGYWTLPALLAPNIRRWVPDPFDPLETVDYAPLATVEDYDALGITSTGGLDSNFAGVDINGNGDFTDAGDYLPFLPATLADFSPVDPANGSTSTLQTSEHGVTSLEPPALDDISQFVTDAAGDYVYDSATDTYNPVPAGTGTHAKGSFFEKAGLVIESYSDGTWKAFDELGLEITADLAGVVTVSQIFDRRQAGGTTDSLDQVEVDMAALALTPHFPTNGLLYMAGQGSGTGTDVNAFTVKNAAELPAGLALVSPDSIYLQGDYNTVVPKPASAMADAINLLSNSWDNSKTAASGLPAATATTYNVSLISGDVASNSTTFSGGPHNLPRRHEDWAGVTETLNGSIVCPFRSKYATNPFHVGSNYYLPPNRVWSYDESNNTDTNLPPFTPTTVEVRSTASWTAQP